MGCPSSGKVSGIKTEISKVVYDYAKQLSVLLIDKYVLFELSI